MSRSSSNMAACVAAALDPSPAATYRSCPCQALTQTKEDQACDCLGSYHVRLTPGLPACPGAARCSASLYSRSISRTTPSSTLRASNLLQISTMSCY
jgi:hypothetical protein